MDRLAARALDRRELDQVLAPIDRARPFPSRAFTGEGVFAFEEQRILGHSWSCIGSVGDLRLPGQWVREIVAGEPIVVVRGPDLRLRAFFDVCLHRGASLVSRAPCGRSERLECPYHGWTYELDGRLAVAPFAASSFDLADHRLREAHVDVWRELVVFSLSDGDPLRRWLGEPA